MDEYERATEELKNVITSVSQPEYEAIADPDTKDKDCRSIQTIMNHVVRAGYGYSIYIRKQFGDTFTERKEDYGLTTAEVACTELESMIAHTSVTLYDKRELNLDEQADNIIKTSWGQDYNIEQLLEHAVVHILRHRRQIERFITKMNEVCN